MAIPLRRFRSRPAIATTAVLVAAVGAVVPWQLGAFGGSTATSGSLTATDSETAGGSMIAIDKAGCAADWRAPSSGATVFSIHNETSATADVALSVGGSKVVAEIPTLGPGVIRPLRVVLEPGTYAWRCTSVDGALTFSPTERVGGKRVADPSPVFNPVNPNDLETSALAYRSWAAKGLNVVALDTDTLERAVRTGNRALAEKDWLVAHLDYERLGAVYDTFGDFNDEINGRADGLVGGVRSPKFTGFLRLEYALWHNQPEATQVAVVTKLDRDVHGLVKAFPSQLLQVTDVPLRSHEILENALQFELTGDTDEGSHTNLATVRANVLGTTEVLATLRPLIVARDPQLLAKAEAHLRSFVQLLDTYRRPDGSWTPVASLSLAGHQRLDAAADGALALLDQIPAILEQASGDSS